MTQTTQASIKAGNMDDQDYHRFLERFGARAAARIANNAVFTTDVQNLWDIYLGSFHEESRQHHNCHACRKFIETYGGLVCIDPTGVAHPLLWEKGDADESDLADPIGRMCTAVAKAKVTGVFYSSLPVWGTPVTGVWHHLSVNNPRVHKHAIMSAFQAMAEKKTEYATVSRALSEFKQEWLDEAERILSADALDRTEKVHGQAKWLRDLKAGASSHHDKRRYANCVWLAVATAPSGFCHPRSSMISTLLDDLVAGYSYNDVAARWSAKMHPLRYQRPQAPPAAGTIRQAEGIVAKLGAAGSLGRRFALLAEVPVWLWTPTSHRAPQAVEGSVFGRLLAQPAKPSTVLPEKAITWDRFSRDVLPTAERIEYHVPLRSQNYGVFTTAVNVDAPNILQWDNLFAWYVWMGGSSAEQFNLPRASWVDVLAITEKPPHFEDPLKFAHHKRGLMLVLAGAKDRRNSGSGLFPECLKAEFHGVRSVIEAFSQTDKVVECEEGQRAQGLILDKGDTWSTLLRVTTDGKQALYRLDRWD